jgi:hypothetical protein
MGCGPWAYQARTSRPDQHLWERSMIMRLADDDTAKDAIRLRMPQRMPGPVAIEWISVNDRLPLAGEEVIVFAEKNSRGYRGRIFFGVCRGVGGLDKRTWICAAGRNGFLDEFLATPSWWASWPIDTLPAGGLT